VARRVVVFTFDSSDTGWRRRFWLTRDYLPEVADFFVGRPSLPIPLKRVLNGGVEAEFFALARHGDRITAQSQYSDIYEREGRDGKMIFVITETTYTNQDGHVLAKIRNTGIRR